MQRAAALEEERGRANKKKRKRSKRHSSSDTEEENPLKALRDTSKLAKVASSDPGALTKLTVEKMQQYLSAHGVQGSREELCPVFTTYLTDVLVPSQRDPIDLRNSRELLTLAQTCDTLLRGDMKSALDLLSQVSRHMELIGEARVSASSAAERRLAHTAERQERRYEAG
eukprot:120984-Amphidinium_carterae.1